MASTRSTSRRDALFGALFVITLVAVVPIDATLHLAGASIPGHAPYATARPITADRLLHGRAGRALATRVVNRSYVGRWLASHHSETMYRIFRRASPASWVGRHRWLFRPFAAREHDAPRWSRAVSAGTEVLARVDRDLEVHGADLLVVLVPGRPRVHPDLAYAEGRLPAGKATFLPAMVQALRDRSVDVVDVTGPLIAHRHGGGEPFYADDFHWTSAGARVAAQAVAARLPERLRAGLRPVVPQPPYEIVWHEAVPSDAALARRLGFVPGSSLERSFTTAAPRATFRGSAPEAWEASCATYWSSSMAAWGSPQFFANEIRCPVRIQWAPGRQFGRKIVDDLQRLQAHGPLRRHHLVVWEIPEDSLHLDRHGAWSVTMRTLARRYGIPRYAPLVSPGWSGLR